VGYCRYYSDYVSINQIGRDDDKELIMNPNAIQKYLEIDYTRAVKFYDNRANCSKLIYRILSIYVISISALLTPLVAFAPDELHWRIFTALLTATIVIASGLLAHLKSHENWLSYRASWDSLERERRLYETNSGKYRTVEDPDTLFVEQIEALLAKEGSEFYSRHATKEQKSLESSSLKSEK
jgi:hypothetical protein